MKSSLFVYFKRWTFHKIPQKYCLGFTRNDGKKHTHIFFFAVDRMTRMLNKHSRLWLENPQPSVTFWNKHSILEVLDLVIFFFFCDCVCAFLCIRIDIFQSSASARAIAMKCGKNDIWLMMIFWWIVAYFVQLISLFTAVSHFFFSLHSCWTDGNAYLDFGNFGCHEFLASNVFKFFFYFTWFLFFCCCSTI